MPAQPNQRPLAPGFSAGQTTRVVTRLTALSTLSVFAMALTVLLTIAANHLEDRAVNAARDRGRLGRDARMSALNLESRLRHQLIVGSTESRSSLDTLRGQLWARVDSLVSASAGRPTDAALVRDLRRALERWDQEVIEPVIRGTMMSPSRELDTTDLESLGISDGFARLRMIQDESFESAVREGDHLHLVAAVVIVVEVVLMTGGLAMARRRLVGQQTMVESTQLEILERLAAAAEFRDDDTGKHTRRVGEVSARIARSMGLDDEQVELIRRAAPLHDVGKIAIPDGILRKPRKLTPEEMAVMRTHTVIGSQMLSGGKSRLINLAERIARSHHERWDGRGYPDGLRSSAIPLEARIVAVADVFDALCSDRPYRKAWSAEDAIAEIMRLRGSHFDPAIVDAFTRGREVASVRSASAAIEWGA